LYDAITKFGLAERKFLDEIKENENEEEKTQLALNLDTMKGNNQNSIDQMKM